MNTEKSDHEHESIPDGESPYYIETSRNLLRWKTEGERSKILVGIDADFDFLRPDTIRVDVMASINSWKREDVSILGWHWCVGIREVEIEIVAIDGAITEATPSTEIEANTVMKTSHSRVSSVTVSPSCHLIPFLPSVNFSVGAFKLEAGQHLTYETLSSNSDSTLSLVVNRSRVKWCIYKPKAPQPVKDFLEENLHVFAICSWNKEGISGKISITPVDVRVYGKDREPLSLAKSLLMIYLVMSKNKRSDLRKIKKQETSFEKIFP